MITDAVEPPRDPPIQPLEFLSGPKVVDIGDVRVKRGLSRRPPSSCPHKSMHYDPHERRIWCPDCEQNIDPFDAFAKIAEQFAAADDNLRRRRAEVAAAEEHTLIALAAKALDQIWRGRRMVPVCPTCGEGLFPEDYKHGRGTALGRDYAAARRAKRGHPVPGYKAVLGSIK